MISLRDRLVDQSASIGAIAEALDASPAAERRNAALALSRAEQRMLFRKAAAAPPVTMADFVPAGIPPLRQVRHYGRNTLPLPRNFQYFEKRFCRPQGDSDRLFGYNAWPPLTRLIGPGYFVAASTAGNPEWQERGAIVVDYFQVPDGLVAEGWPRVIPNTERLQKFIFNRTRDFMRRLSTHVTIGAAYRAEKPLDYYFVLVRAEQM